MTRGMPGVAMAEAHQSFAEKQETNIETREATATLSRAPVAQHDDDIHRRHLPFLHHDHRRHRLQHLIHPSGKHVHIVHHPTEVEPKRLELAKDEKYSNSSYDYDVVIYGSREIFPSFATSRIITYHVENLCDRRTRNSLKNLTSSTIRLITSPMNLLS